MEKFRNLLLAILLLILTFVWRQAYLDSKAQWKTNESLKNPKLPFMENQKKFFEEIRQFREFAGPETEFLIFTDSPEYSDLIPYEGMVKLALAPAMAKFIDAELQIWNKNEIYLFPIGHVLENKSPGVTKLKLTEHWKGMKVK